MCQTLQNGFFTMVYTRRKLHAGSDCVRQPAEVKPKNCTGGIEDQRS